MNAGHVLLLALVSTACSPAPRPEEPAASSEVATATAAPKDPVELARSAAASAATDGRILQDAPLEVQEHTLDATVKAVSPLAENANRSVVHVADADPRFVVELELLGVAPAMADDPKGSALVAGSTVSFGIHSPARLFKSDAEMAGKRMHFSVTRTRTKSGVSFSALHVE